MLVAKSSYSSSSSSRSGITRDSDADSPIASTWPRLFPCMSLFLASTPLPASRYLYSLLSFLSPTGAMEVDGTTTAWHGAARHVASSRKESPSNLARELGQPLRVSPLVVVPGVDLRSDKGTRHTHGFRQGAGHTGSHQHRQEGSGGGWA